MDGTDHRAPAIVPPWIALALVASLLVVWAAIVRF
jgi:hypothetical protein